MQIYELAKPDILCCLVAWCLGNYSSSTQWAPSARAPPFGYLLSGCSAVQCWDIWSFRSLKINPMTTHFCAFYRNDKNYSIRLLLTCSGFPFYSCQESHLVKLIKPACQKERGKEQRNVNTASLEARAITFFFLGKKVRCLWGRRRGWGGGGALHTVSIL